MIKSYFKSKIGIIEIGCKDGLIISIKLCKNMPDEVPWEDVIPSVSISAYSQLCEYLDGKRKNFDFPYKLTGTDFQIKVWESLKTIPYGETRSYKQIAEQIGRPKAVRAAGTAMNKNPIAFALPCHRVIGANGGLVGYAYGLDLKKRLLELENKNK